MSENVALEWTLEDAVEDVGEGSPLLYAVAFHAQPDRVRELLATGGFRCYAWVSGDDVHARLSPVVPTLAGLADAGGPARRVRPPIRSRRRGCKRPDLTREPRPTEPLRQSPDELQPSLREGF